MRRQAGEWTGRSPSQVSHWSTGCTCLRKVPSHSESNSRKGCWSVTVSWHPAVTAYTRRKSMGLTLSFIHKPRKRQHSRDATKRFEDIMCAGSLPWLLRHRSCGRRWPAPPEVLNGRSTDGCSLLPQRRLPYSLLRQTGLLGLPPRQCPAHARWTMSMGEMAGHGGSHGMNLAQTSLQQRQPVPTSSLENSRKWLGRCDSAKNSRGLDSLRP